MSRAVELFDLTDCAWSLMELWEDPLSGYLKPEQYAAYVLPAMADGKQAAAGMTIERIKENLKEWGVQAVLVKEGNPIQVHAQTLWNHGVLKVELFETVMTQIGRLLETAGIAMTEQEITDLHLAHEYYHCVEYLQDRMISRRLEPVFYRTMGVIRRKGYVSRTREIAAHMFAREVCAFPFHPKCLDLLLWEAQDEAFAEDYYERCRRAAGWAGRIINE